MDPNPYQAPKNYEPQQKANPLVTAGLSVFGFAAAVYLIIRGVVMTFIWGIGYKLIPQIAYGALFLVAGVLVLVRLARYLRMHHHTGQNLGWRKIVVALLIWVVILIPLILDIVALVWLYVWQIE